MKLFELAKQLGVQSKDVTQLLSESGEEKVSHMTALTDEQIDFIKSEFGTVAQQKADAEARKQAELEARIKVEEEAKIEAQKKIKVEIKKTDADYRPDEMIPCRAIFPGILIFNGDHTGMTYKFTGTGDRRNIEYQDLKAGLLQNAPAMFTPDFIIEDENLIEDEHWMELKRVYETMYDEKDIEKVLALPTRDFEAAFVQLPVTARKAIITIVASQIENGTFEQYNKAVIIDRICGTRFDLKMTN